MDRKKKILLVDGHALVYRAFHALPPSLSTAKGEMTNAVFGFTQMLLDALAKEQPDCVVMTFDVGKTFRHEEYDGYKANRKPMPPELFGQIGRVRQVVEALGIPVYESPGYEADDVIGSLAKEAERQGMEAVILTGDSDALQLVNGCVRVVTPGGKRFSETAKYDVPAVVEKYGFAPEYIADYKSLVGDSSDNIPGVNGIGKKGATDLIVRYGTLDNIYQHIDEITSKRTREALESQREEAFFSKRLATIVDTLPVEIDAEQCRTSSFDRAKVVELFRELEFRSLLPKIPVPDSTRPVVNTEPEAIAYVQGEELDGPAQLSLFDSASAASMAIHRGAAGKLQSATSGKCFTVVRDEKALEELVSTFSKDRAVTVDVETTGRDAMTADLVGIAISGEADKAYYIPLGHTCAEDSTPQLSMETVADKLSPFLAGIDYCKQAHNGKYDMMVLERHGFSFENLEFDTMIAGYLLGETSLSLADLAFVKLGMEKTPITDLIGKSGRSQITMAEVPVGLAYSYACNDVDLTYRLSELLRRSLDEAGLNELFRNVEMPLVPVLAQMEMDGIALDVPFLMEMSRALYARVTELEERIYQEAGHRFNLNSPQQLSGVLFDQLGLPGGKKTQKGYSTNQKVLEGLKGRHPIVDLILDYRQLSKLKSTYVDALPLLVNPRTGRVHTSFNQTITSTGRLSSSDPNLQNIPIRSDIGREVRRAFVADNFSDKPLVSRPSILMSADYSQVELRILAHYSGDPRLVSAFQTGQDVHAATAAEVFGVDAAQVNAEMRRVAKTVNFGIMYGMSPFGLSRDTGLSPNEAAKFVNDYMEKYRGVQRYIDRTLDEVKSLGYVTTMLGRRRYIPEIRSMDRNVRQQAERMAINMPIQGTAADIIKIAMVELPKALKREGLSGRLLLQVHDELLLEVPQAEADETADVLKSVMENAFKLDVPLTVEVKRGQNWGEMV